MKNCRLLFVLKMALGLFIFSSLFFSCRNSSGGEGETERVTEVVSEFVTAVEVTIIEPSTFTLELISNGKLRARRKSRIAYPFGEELVGLMVQNGQQVKAGQGLAQLSSENLERRLEQARLRFARVSIEMEDLLLGRGYTLNDSLAVPSEIWQMASITSGYSEASSELRHLHEDLEKTLVKAPYAGAVAGITVQAFERVNPGEVFCTLIDNSAFLAEFPVMENELPWIAPGLKVEIEPFGMPGIIRQGEVLAVNPMVDEHGRVQVTALISPAGDLLDGMNVRVKVKREVPKQLVVPRQAVLYRDNLEVLFKYAGGRAEWTYVNIIHQNSSHFSVMANPDRVASLQPGDTVIVSGNMNLAHGSLVKIQ
ncbi:MAG: efflux RND transporter periplasmic adaptor subunit [Bacteroidales bacterium]|jgi:RND family efflux transporter MFP subunit|nr:efflux RND transporter periplasmic adaptor subunit [Bacteroidales bacterium]